MSAPTVTVNAVTVVQTPTVLVRDILITVGLAAVGIEFVNWIRKEQRYKSALAFIISYPGWSIFGATSFGCLAYLFSRPVVNMLPWVRH